jgi:hypothetical protein
MSLKRHFHNSEMDLNRRNPSFRRFSEQNRRPRA